MHLRYIVEQKQLNLNALGRAKSVVSVSDCRILDKNYTKLYNLCFVFDVNGFMLRRSKLWES